MAVIRVEKSADYTCISNFNLRDPRLSLRAVGLLSRMLSYPADWTFSVAWLVKNCKEGRDAIKAALAELEEAGYLTREQTHDETGQFGRMDFVLHEKPPLTEKPSTEKPSTDLPSTVNPQLRNTVELINNIYTNTPYSPPEGDGASDSADRDEGDGEADCHVAPLLAMTGGADNPSATRQEPPDGRLLACMTPAGAQGAAETGRENRAKPRKKREPKAAPDWEPERFKGFWQAYPRGENKQAAIAAWDKLHADAGLLNRMARALKKQLASEEWRRGIGIPYAATWLNGRRWEDEDKRPGQLPEPTGMDEGEAAWM